MNITVYLGAFKGKDAALADAVRELGTWIGESGNALVYGGSKSGLMGMLAFPGGTGTLEEITEVMSKVSLKHLAHMITMGLSSEERQEGIYFAKNLAEIREILGQ